MTDPAPLRITPLRLPTPMCCAVHFCVFYAENAVWSRDGQRGAGLCARHTKVARRRPGEFFTDLFDREPSARR